MKTQAQFMNAKISDLRNYFAQVTSLIDYAEDKGIKKSIDEFGNEVVVKKNQYAEYDVYVKTGKGKWDEEPVETVHIKTTQDGWAFDISAGKTIQVEGDEEPHFIGKRTEGKNYFVDYWFNKRNKLLSRTEGTKKGQVKTFYEDDGSSEVYTPDGRHYTVESGNVSDLHKEKKKDKEGRSAVLKKVLEAGTKEGKKAALKEFHSQQSPAGVKRRTALKFDR